MEGLRYHAIRLALSSIAALGADRLLAPRLRGLGCILTFHRITRDRTPLLPENAGLNITPEFLDAVLIEIRRLGYDTVPLDEVPARLAAPHERPFVALTFDDGYTDLLTHALPILKSHNAPFAAFLCPGFQDRTAPLWWLDLEEALVRADTLDVALPYAHFTAPARTTEEKQRAMRGLYWRLRRLDERSFRQVMEAIRLKYGIEPGRQPEALCMSWAQVKELAQEPLATIGAHTMTHPRLAAMPIEEAEREMRLSRDTIAMTLGRSPKHFCYPVGDATSAGAREAEIARRLGFVTALTTRANVLRSGVDLQLLPRISVNGLFQQPAYLRALMSGVPFAFR